MNNLQFINTFSALMPQIEKVAYIDSGPSNEIFSKICRVTPNNKKAAKFEFACYANGGVRLFVDDAIVIEYFEDSIKEHQDFSSILKSIVGGKIVQVSWTRKNILAGYTAIFGEEDKKIVVRESNPFLFLLLWPQKTEKKYEPY